MSKIRIIINNKEKNINLLNDFLFSKTLGERGCERETLYVINIITGENFESLTYETNEIQGLHEGNKKSITDVLVTTNNGTVVNIESQIAEQKDFHKRSHFYNAKISSILLRIGQDYEKLPMTILINILNFTLHESLEDYHTTFKPTEIKNKNYSLDDIMETHYIELPKFRKQVKEGNINLDDPKIRLILLLDEESPQELIEEVLKMDEFAKSIYEKSAEVLQDQKQYLAYIRAEQTELDKKAMIKFADEKGFKKGRKEGKKEGKEDKEIEIALKLKKLDFSIEEIAEITGMPPMIIKKL